MTFKELKKAIDDLAGGDAAMTAEELREREDMEIESWLAEKRDERIAKAHPESKYYVKELRIWEYQCPGYKPDGTQCLCVYENQSEEELRLIQRNRDPNYDPATDPNRKF